jgi:hypothetical protein
LPFRVFGSAAWLSSLLPKAVLSELAARSEFQPAEVSSVLVRRSRCAVGRSLSSAVFPRRARRPQLSDRTIPLFEFRSPSEYYPSDPSQPSWAPPAPLMGFLFPSAHTGIGGPLAAGLPNPLRSALRVWLPSRRLTPSEPAPVLFRTDSALGIYPSELSPSTRYPVRFRPEAPTYRFSCRCYRRRDDGPARQAAVPGLQPLRKSLAAGRGISTSTAGCSLGFFPF